MDICDDANVRADLFRKNALNATRQNSAVAGESSLHIDGVRCCLDCKKPIPNKRLKANPDAVRCVGCQTKREKNN